MVKYHIRADGTPGICRARDGNCPLGNNTAHYNNLSEANEASQKLLASQHNMFSNDSNDIDKVMNDRFIEFKNNGTNYTMSEALVRGEWVDEKTRIAISEGRDSVSLYKVDGVWDEDRAALHNKLIQDKLDEYRDIPNEGQVIFSAGLPGAGKTTVLTGELGIKGNDYATVSSDDFKEALAEHGAIPHIEGLTPMEASTLVHLESSELADRLLSQLASENKNIIYDFTCRKEEVTMRRIDSLRNHGYSTSNMQFVFVDIPVDTTIERTKGRYMKGLNNDKFGGRYLPESAVMSSKPDKSSKYNSKNAEVIMALSNNEELNIPNPIIYDNSGAHPINVDFNVFKNGYRK